MGKYCQRCGREFNGAADLCDACQSKHCQICGREFSGGGDVCDACLFKSYSQSEDYHPNQMNQRSMNENSLYESSPQRIEDCCNPDLISATLAKYSSVIQTVGRLLLFLTLVFGFFIAYRSATAASAEDELIRLLQSKSKSTSETTDFNTTRFLTTLFPYILFAFADFIIFKTCSLLLVASAKITNSTRTAARLAEYEARRK